MSRSDWYTRSAATIAFIVILTTASFLGYVVLRDSTYNRAYKQAQAQYAAAEADRQLRNDCMALGIPKKVLACLQDKVKPGRETQRAEDDLQAQKDMADATWGMLVISIVVGFSSIGVAVWVGLFVRDTLDETRKSTSAAVEMLELERRGYLIVKTFRFHRAIWTANNQEMNGFFIIPVFDNVGKVPLIVSRFVMSTRVVEDDDISSVDWNEEIDAPESSIVIGPNSPVNAEKIIINLAALERIYSGEIRVLYMLRIQYRSIFDVDARLHLHQCFELKTIGDPIAVFENKTLSPSQYLSMETRGEFSSAS